MKVLFTGCVFNEEKIEQLKLKNIIVDSGRTDYSEDELIEKLKDYDCYINGGDEICTDKVIENNKHLKLISFMGSGYQKYINVESAKKYNIPVTYTPSANARSVAEYTVALILDCVKKITYTNNEVKIGNWNKYKAFDLHGKIIGIVGMGAIGKQVAQILCDGFGMKLLYNSRTSKNEIDSKYNTKICDLNTLFKEADVISINATCNEESKGMITKEQLSLMKENAVLVNTARAELINESDLYDYISSKNINAVAIDGFYKEPLEDKDNRFNKLSNDKFIITSHNAYNSTDALIKMENMLIESLEDVLNNKEKIRNIVE